MNCCSTYILKQHPILLFALSVIVLSSTQWILLTFYTSNCMERSLIGLLVNPLSLGSPLCQFVNNAQVTLANHYTTMWMWSATAHFVWFCNGFMNQYFYKRETIPVSQKKTHMCA